MGLQFPACAHSLSANGMSLLTCPAGWSHFIVFSGFQEMLRITKNNNLQQSSPFQPRTKV